MMSSELQTTYVAVERLAGLVREMEEDLQLRLPFPIRRKARICMRKITDGREELTAEINDWCAPATRWIDHVDPRGSATTS
jgi:hypothetical protein